MYLLLCCTVSLLFLQLFETNLPVDSGLPYNLYRHSIPRNALAYCYRENANHKSYIMQGAIGPWLSHRISWPPAVSWIIATLVGPVHVLPMILPIVRVARV